jgi:cystathionine beta-lyase/cystathionine gamma-synthase
MIGRDRRPGGRGGAMDEEKLSLQTRAIHAGRISPRIEGAAVLPIFQCSVYEHTAEGADYHDVRYPRLSNLPNHDVLGRRLASLEAAESALVTSSGMAAISTAMLAVLGEGGHLLIQDQLYGGTHSFVTRDFRSYGLTYDFIAPDDPDSWRTKLRPNTRAIYVETMTNPLLQVADHRAVVAFAREHALVSMIDNTFATPVNFRPIEMGFDLSLHSCTKYLNGHSDLVAGALIGTTERVRGIKQRLDHLGGSLDPHACYLLERGLKTLVLRVRQQNASALALARRLHEHPRVRRVNYPGLETHPEHARARELFEGFGGMLSFEPDGGLEAAKRFLDRVELPINGPSLGGVETLVTRPVTTSHAGLTPAERARIGIRDSLIRVSVGVEDAGDLIRDFEAALG